MIQALHCLSQVSGVLKFIGIVVDASRKQLKGYMIEYIAGKSQGLACRLSREERIPWKRRENWARQIVEAISQVHGMGFVSGALWTSILTISVTDSDNITLNSFGNKMETVPSFPGNMPPECRHLRSSKNELRKAINVTPKIDMFQLGMLLWLIGKQRPNMTSMDFCKLAGCNAPFANSCNQKHSDPIGLPVLDDVPQYYNDIIALCRNEDPTDRPPAWRLLEMFPSNTDLEPLQAGSPIEEIPDIDILKASYAEGPFCDHCRHRNGSASFFHCTACQDGDWDMCLSCYNKGLHCLDPDHFLVEIKQMHVSAVPGSHDFTAVPGSYRSSVNASGHREIIEL
jgi:serine/threonine protein kinase